MARTPGEDGIAAAKLEACYEAASQKLREEEAFGADNAEMIAYWLDLVDRYAAELRTLGMLTQDRPPDAELLSAED